jgi:hypothetical protein
MRAQNTVIASQRVGAKRRPLSEAIQNRKEGWIASSQELLAMTTGLRRRHHDRIAFRREHDVQPAGLRQQPRVIGLHGMGIDRSGGAGAQQVGDGLRHPRIQAGGRNAKTAGLAGADRIDGQHAAARNGLLRDHHHVEQQFYLVLGQKLAWQIPGDPGPVVFEMPARHGLGVADVDLRAGRSRSTKCQPAELQARRRRLRALADQVEREFAVVRFGIVVEHLEPVDDGADRTDEVVAHPRAQQRREFEDVGRGAGRRRAGHQICSWKALGTRRIMRALVLDTLRALGPPTPSADREKRREDRPCVRHP